MKQTFFAVCLVFIAQSITGQTIYPSGVTGCVARWTFSNVTSATTQIPDASGNGNDAAASNLATFSNFKSIPNAAALFNGNANSNALVPHSGTLNLNEVTMVAVVRPKGFYSALCQNSQILSKGFPHAIPGNYGIGFTDNIFDNGDCNAYNPNRQQLAAQFGNSNPANPALTPGNYISGAGRWYFLATTFGGNQIRYYQVEMLPNQQFTNIQPIYSATTTSAGMGFNTQPVSIGYHLNPTFPYNFNGAIDEIVLFNRPLTGGEIQSVYDHIWGLTNRPANTTGVESSPSMSAMELYHNSGIIRLHNLNSSARAVRVTNVAGQALFQGSGAQISNSIDLSMHRAQVLFVQIQFTDGVETIKFFND